MSHMSVFQQGRVFVCRVDRTHRRTNLTRKLCQGNIARLWEVLQSLLVISNIVYKKYA